MALNYLGKISNGSLLILVTVRVQSIHFLLAREPTSKKVALDNSSKSQVSTESSGRATVSNLNPFSLELCRATSKLLLWWMCPTANRGGLSIEKTSPWWPLEP